MARQQRGSECFWVYRFHVVCDCTRRVQYRLPRIQWSSAFDDVAERVEELILRHALSPPRFLFSTIHCCRCVVGFDSRRSFLVILTWQGFTVELEPLAPWLVAICLDLFALLPSD